MLRTADLLVLLYSMYINYILCVLCTVHINFYIGTTLIVDVVPLEVTASVKPPYEITNLKVVKSVLLMHGAVC